MDMFHEEGKKMKRILALIAVLLIAALMPWAVMGEDAPAAFQAPNAEDYFTNRDLAGTWEEKDAVALSLTDSVTITQAGTYVLSGTLQEGSVTVNVGDSDKVQLVLSGVSVTSSHGAALLVENADKVFVTLAPGTENALISTGFDANSDVDGAVFARDDIVFNGSGSLTVTSANHGIVGKDDVKFASGAYGIIAQGRGVDANDSIRIYDGTFVIDGQKDAFRAKHEEADKGYILIFGGTFDLTVNGGAQNGQDHTEAMGFGRQQWGWNTASASASDTTSRKGVKASGSLTILGGAFTVNTADDAFHSNSDLTILGGVYAVATGDDAFHADGTLAFYDGQVQITQSYEGLEGQNIVMAGGHISLIASDDGVNAAGGNDGSGWGFYDVFSSDGVSSITISGGTLIINASGDGIDSNGDLTVTGGTILVSGPTNSGNGALDCAGTATITGGTVIAAGAAGMAENFGSASTQVSMLVTLNGSAGTITVKDADGKAILSGNVEKSFQCVVISSPDLQLGQTYTVSCGGASTSVTPTAIITGGAGGFGRGGSRMNGMPGWQGGGFGGGQGAPEGQPPEGQAPAGQGGGFKNNGRPGHMGGGR